MKHRRSTLMLASVASMIDQFNMPNIRLMQEMGYEVHVACNFKEGNTCDMQRIRKFQKTLQKLGVIRHQWDCPRSVLPVSGCCRAYMQLWKLTGRYHYEWIHCHSPIGGVLARVAAHRRGIRVIYTAHGFHFYQGAPWKNWILYYPVEKLLAHCTDVLITVNREDYIFAKKNLRAKKIRYIPGVGIDIKKFAVKTDDQEEKSCRESSACPVSQAEIFRRKYQIPDRAKILLSVGELNEGKNHKMVITALAELKRQDVYYLICGQGALYDELEKYARSLGVGNCVRMPGFLEELVWIYQNADIFVFPSLREGMPVSLMEAMAAGLPCVVSDIRGNRELIDDAGRDLVCSGGIRFSLGHPEQLHNALRMLLDHASLRQKYGRYNQKRIKRYGQEAVQRRMKMIYEEIEKCK